MIIKERIERIRAINRALGADLPMPRRVELICDKLKLNGYGPGWMKGETDADRFAQ